MMLTPVFELSQDDTYIIIQIKAPYSKVSDTEIFIEGCEFRFYSKPYYLRLNFPGEIKEDGRESAKYSSDAGAYTVRVPKATPGEKFEDLDMLAKLLAPIKHDNTGQPSIEVLDRESCPTADQPEQEDEEEEDFDWQIEQEIHQPEAHMIGAPRYGFGHQKSGVLERLQSEMPDVIDLPSADKTAECERRVLRVEDESAHFDDEYYLADLYQTEGIDALMTYSSPWISDYKKLKQGADLDTMLKWTDDEKEAILKLPRKEYILDDGEQKMALLSLIDIIFAYAYSYRITEGESNVESGCNICKISSTLSWLDTPHNVRDAVITCYRRCLTYGLYRHWELTNTILKDVIAIFTLGKKQLAKCLLDTQRILRECDPKYVLCDLYITDYCVWIQSVSAKKILSLAKALEEIKVSKDGVDLDLELTEHAARLAIEEQAAALSQQMASLSVDSESRGTTETDETRESGGTRAVFNNSNIDYELASSVDSNTSSDTDSEYETDTQESAEEGESEGGDRESTGKRKESLGKGNDYGTDEGKVESKNYEKGRIKSKDTDDNINSGEIISKEDNTDESSCDKEEIVSKDSQKVSDDVICGIATRTKQLNIDFKDNTEELNKECDSKQDSDLRKQDTTSLNF